MQIRQAQRQDISAVAGIYERIHSAEERGQLTVGWARGVYPTAATAQQAESAGQLYVGEEGGAIVAAAIINQVQPDSYREGRWQLPASERDVMVLHTLVVDPACQGRGAGAQFVAFYEEFARSCGCHVLRIDTQEKNRVARALYRKLGYHETDVVPCEFNGIEGVRLVLLEKAL